MMQWPRSLTILLLTLTLLMVSGCNFLGPTGPEECNDGGTLLTDEFEGERDCGWIMYDKGGTVVEVADGALQMSSSQPGQFWWTNPGRNFSDVTITTQARQGGGPDDNAYGVICRYQNPENFYIFLISGDGYYAIGKYQTGSSSIQYLTGGGEYVYSDVINQGVATNNMRVSCVGNELSLTVNGIELDTVVDPTFVTGDVGLGVTTFQPGTAVVQFDSLTVREP